MDDLLADLAAGDEKAAELVYKRCLPLLRLIIRRQMSSELQSRFDSEDICQSVWADLVNRLRAGRLAFTSSAQLRAFLIRAVKNRFIDRVRQAATVNMERGTDKGVTDLPDSVPTPSECAEANELWDEVVRACPPQHRIILEMKREGRSLSEIAEKTGMHPSSIRRVVYNLAYRFGAESRASERA